MTKKKARPLRPHGRSRYYPPGDQRKRNDTDRVDMVLLLTQVVVLSVVAVVSAITDAFRTGLVAGFLAILPIAGKVTASFAPDFRPFLRTGGLAVLQEKRPRQVMAKSGSSKEKHRASREGLVIQAIRTGGLAVLHDHKGRKQQ